MNLHNNQDLINMKISEFSALNKIRCESKSGFSQKIDEWSLSDWMTAIVGELGETANLVKKLKRSETTGALSKFTDIDENALKSDIGKEIADVFCYLDLFAHSCDIDLATVVKEKFNIVSDRIGSDIKIRDNEEGWIHINDALPPVDELVIFTSEVWESFFAPDAGYWTGEWNDEQTALVMRDTSELFLDVDDWSSCTFWRPMPSLPPARDIN
jgi:NTP pyrophosphatase (non-canonical NTP hydrolase)